MSSTSFKTEEVKDKSVVVLDVLRATTTIVTAIMNGVKGVIPVEDMNEASKISQSVDSDNYLLCGESEGVKIEGYDLGNSPREYTPEVISGKTMIFNTTNGTKAIRKSVGARKVIIASFLNLDAVINTLKKDNNEIVLVCSGWRGRLALEDLMLAGNIIYELFEGKLEENARDGAKVAFGLYEKYGNNLGKVIMNSNHAERLKEIIGEEDVKYCCQVNSTSVLPVLNEGIITDKHVKQL